MPKTDDTKKLKEIMLEALDTFEKHEKQNQIIKQKIKKLLEESKSSSDQRELLNTLKKIDSL